MKSNKTKLPFILGMTAMMFAQRNEPIIIKKTSNYTAIDGSKPTKRRLKVKLARKANVQRQIKAK